MKLRDPHSKTHSFAPHRPKGLDSKSWEYIRPIMKALQRSHQQIGRFRFYNYLAAVYATYAAWQERGICKSMTRKLVGYLGNRCRQGTSPIRTLIDATFPALDPKLKSRWSRALEFAAMKKTSPDDFLHLLERSSGIGGCARSAAKETPKKDTNRNDWL